MTPTRVKPRSAEISSHTIELSKIEKTERGAPQSASRKIVYQRGLVKFLFERGKPNISATQKPVKK